MVSSHFSARWISPSFAQAAMTPPKVITFGQGPSSIVFRTNSLARLTFPVKMHAEIRVLKETTFVSRTCSFFPKEETFGFPPGQR
jgi:hypothetical protein